MRTLILVCLGLALVSLVLPSAPTYDPWSWIVWGRELAHLRLDTTGGPSWKPLPVAFTTLFAPFGALDDSLPPALWLVVARAGALLALALAFRLARRLVGAGPGGVAAGVTAAVALALTPQWLRYAAHGNEAPLAAALMLWAVHSHLDGSRRGALVLGFAACLMRPEVFPFVALYGAWCWRAEPDMRRMTVGLAVALAALWLIPEWIGSGQPLGAGAQARSEPSWSLSLREHPWLEALGRAHGVAGPLLEAGLLAAIVLAVRRRDRLELGLAAATVGVLALFVGMTQAGFSGNSRYLLPAIVVACVLTGVAAARLVALTPRPAAATATAALLAAISVPFVLDGVGGLKREARQARQTAQLDADLGVAVSRAGGGDTVVKRGAPAVDRAFTPHMAWLTTLPVGQVERSRGAALVFAAGRRDPSSLVAQADPALPVGSLRSLVAAGRWRVFERGSDAGARGSGHGFTSVQRATSW